MKKYEHEEKNERIHQNNDNDEEHNERENSKNNNDDAVIKIADAHNSNSASITPPNVIHKKKNKNHTSQSQSQPQPPPKNSLRTESEGSCGLQYTSCSMPKRIQQNNNNPSSLTSKEVLELTSSDHSGQSVTTSVIHPLTSRLSSIRSFESSGEVIVEKKESLKPGAFRVGGKNKYDDDDYNDGMTGDSFRTTGSNSTTISKDTSQGMYWIPQASLVPAHPSNPPQHGQLHGHIHQENRLEYIEEELTDEVHLETLSKPVAEPHQGSVVVSKRLIYCTAVGFCIIVVALSTLLTVVLVVRNSDQRQSQNFASIQSPTLSPTTAPSLPPSSDGIGDDNGRDRDRDGPNGGGGGGGGGRESKNSKDRGADGVTREDEENSLDGLFN